MKLSLSLLSILALTVTAQAQAQTQNQKTSGTAGTAYNPFTQGTVKVVLTTEEKADLLTYADNSKARLLKAKEQAAGKSFDEANQIYTRAIIDVVMDSFRQKARSELLMRFALNEALELTTGIPTADGRSISQEGLLKHISNQDLLTVVLEQSIDLALSFYAQDRQAIEGGSLAKLPYAAFANEKLRLSRSWLTAVIESKYQYALSIKILEHFTATVSNSDQTERAKYAEEMLLVDQTLQTMQAAPGGNEERASRVRKLRFTLRKLNEGLSQKLAANPAATGVPAHSERSATAANSAGQYQSAGNLGEITSHISAAASGTLIAGIQNGSVRPNEIRTFSESELRFPGTNLQFSLAQPGANNASNADGICKILGYAKALAGSAKYEKSSDGIDLIINEEGNSTGGVKYFHTTAITCLNLTGQRTFKSLHQFNSAELFYPGTKLKLSLAVPGADHYSDPDGICILFGYQAALKGSTTFEQTADEASLVINAKGESVGGVNYFSTTSITCMNLN